MADQNFRVKNGLDVGIGGTVITTTPSGLVGIGTTIPTTKLEINGVLGFGTFTGIFGGTRTNVRIGDTTTGANLTTGYDNIFMGIGAGNSTTSGRFNNFFGNSAGYNNTIGDFNNFFGDQAGRFSISGFYNNFFGRQAGYCNNNGYHNNFFGQCAGYSNTTADLNNFIGRFAGRCNTTGGRNNFFGSYSGIDNTTGTYNNFFGHRAGPNNTTGCRNNFFGCCAGERNNTGSNNIFLGNEAGSCNTTGNFNTFLGNHTGLSTSASNKVIFGRGNASNLFDAPDTTKDTQFAVGIRTDANPANYWLVGDENFNVGIGTTNPTQKLHVGGNLRVTGGLYDSNNNVGTAGSVLSSTGSGINWIPVTSSSWSKKTTTYTAVTGDQLIADTSGGAFTITLPASPSTGDSIRIADGDDWETNNLTIGRNSSTIEGGTEDFVLDIKGITVDFIYDGTTWEVYASVGPRGQTGADAVYNTGITTSIYVSVDSGIGIGVTNTNDIFIGPGIGYSFPSTAGKKYIIESIHFTNIFSNELYLSARQDFFQSSNNWLSVPMAQRVIVPYQGATELLFNQPIIANPSDILRFQALTETGSTAVGVDGGLDAFIVYSEKNDTNYIGVGSTITSSSGNEIYTSTTYPTTVQSIRLTNYNLNIDIDASVSIYRGGTVGGIVTTGVRQGYLAYNMTIPKNSVVEILDKAKYLAVNDSIVVLASTTNSLSVCVSGKKIV